MHPAPRPSPPSDPRNGETETRLKRLTEYYLEQALASQPEEIALDEDLRAALRPACRRAADTSLNLQATSMPSAQRREIVMAQLWEEVLPMLPGDPDPLNEEHPTGWDPQLEEDGDPDAPPPTG